MWFTSHPVVFGLHSHAPQWLDCLWAGRDWACSHHQAPLPVSACRCALPPPSPACLCRKIKMWTFHYRQTFFFSVTMLTSERQIWSQRTFIKKCIFTSRRVYRSVDVCCFQMKAILCLCNRVLLNYSYFNLRQPAQIYFPKCVLQARKITCSAFPDISDPLLPSFIYHSNLTIFSLSFLTQLPFFLTGISIPLQLRLLLERIYSTYLTILMFSTSLSISLPLGYNVFLIRDIRKEG